MISLCYTTISLYPLTMVCNSLLMAVFMIDPNKETIADEMFSRSNHHAMPGHWPSRPHRPSSREDGTRYCPNTPLRVTGPHHNSQFSSLAWDGMCLCKEVDFDGSRLSVSCFWLDRERWKMLNVRRSRQSVLWSWIGHRL